METEAQGNKRPFPRCCGTQEEKPSSSHSPPASTSFVLHDSIFAKQSLEDTMCAFDLGLISPSKSYKKIRNSSIKYGGKWAGQKLRVGWLGKGIKKTRVLERCFGKMREWARAMYPFSGLERWIRVLTILQRALGQHQSFRSSFLPSSSLGLKTLPNLPLWFLPITHGDDLVFTNQVELSCLLLSDPLWTFHSEAVIEMPLDLSLLNYHTCFSEDWWGKMSPFLKTVVFMLNRNGNSSEF